MRPLTGPDTGVYFERVGVETIAALEAEFDYSGLTAFDE
jgi:hypothetical protein